MWQFREIN
ncbi:UNVERIFIED_CONTAM: hypothetical protein GTU68_031745 [Idotea baltica]|nr:hypothetical protein [Idotea baltica]